MYTLRLSVTGVSILMLGISKLFNLTLITLLIVTLSIILFRFTRLLIKEGTLKKLILITFISLPMLFIAIVLGKAESNNRIDEAEEILINYKNTLYEELKVVEATSIEESEENIVGYNPEPGEIIGLLNIEKISLELPIIEDSNDENLWVGAAHIMGTPHYWEEGNSFLSSHNIKTYGKLFNRLHELVVGDEIIISNSRNSYLYVVYDVEVVSPDDTDCFEKINGEYNLSLVTCIDSGAKRLIVYCERVQKIL